MIKTDVENYIYMAYTADELETPLVVKDSISEIAKWLNIPYYTALSRIQRGCKGRDGTKIARIKL